MIQFREAKRLKLPAKIALFGPSGSGKTLSALRIARGLVGPAGKIVLIDTENDRSLLYANRTTWGEPIKFVHGTLADPTVENMMAAIVEAKKIGDAVIIDSISHSWQEILAESNRMTASGYRGGNSFSTWAKLTPKQAEFIKCLLWLEKHLICTMRSKSEYVLEEVEVHGKKRMQPKFVGLEPIQGKSIEYEFDQLFALDMEHNVQVLKDRSSLLQDRVVNMPDEKLGEELAAWLDSGDAAEARASDEGSIFAEPQEDAPPRVSAPALQENSLLKEMEIALMKHDADFKACRDFAIDVCQYIQKGQELKDIKEEHMREIIRRTDQFVKKAHEYYQELLSDV